MDNMEFEEEIKDSEYFERQIIELAERISDLEDKIKELENRPTTIKIIDANGQCIHLTLPLASYKETK